MSWIDKYDKVNTTFDGDIAIFGDFYTLKQAKDILKEEEWDDDVEINELKEIELVWLRFGFVNYDDENTNGWKVLDKEPESKRGCIKATMLYKKRIFSEGDKNEM